MPSEAIVAKARAMYSLHLKEDDYRQLTEIREIKDIATYFEKHPRYQGLMEGIRNVDIHRDILEQRIRVMVPLEYNSLLRFEQFNRERSFFSYDLERDLIVDMLYALSHNVVYQPTRDIVELSKSFSFNVADLVNCKSMDMVLQIIAKSPYSSIVSEEIKKDTPIWVIELKLYDFYVQYVLEHDVGSNEEYKDIFSFDVELRRVQEAFRIMIHNNQEHIKIFNDYTWIPYKLRKQDVLDWMKTEDLDLFVANAKAKMKMPHEVYRSTFEKHCDRMRLKKALKVLRFSQDSKAIIYAYKMLMDIEVKNVVSVIEGIRYRRNIQVTREQLVFEVKHGN